MTNVTKKKKKREVKLVGSCAHFGTRDALPLLTLQITRIATAGVLLSAFVPMESGRDISLESVQRFFTSKITPIKHRLLGKTTQV